MTDNAMLIGLSRQTALRRQMDVVANNLANLDTPGFRAEDMLFAEHVMPNAEVRADRGADRTLSYVIDRSTVRDFAPGPLDSTGNALDVALDGDGWLAVATPDGERYTRNGALRLDAEGGLVTADGHRVQGEGGDILFDDDETDVTIADDGTVSTELGEKDRLRVVAFEDNEVLTAEGASLFSADEAPGAAAETRVVQGAIEGANVTPVLEMSRMIEVTRRYASLAQMMERGDELRRQAIGTLGRVE